MITGPESQEPGALKRPARQGTPSLQELRRLADVLSANVSAHLAELRCHPQAKCEAAADFQPSATKYDRKARNVNNPYSQQRRSPQRPGTGQPRPGQLAYDPASQRTGIVQAVHPTTELLFNPKVTGTRIAFLRPEGGGREWTANADSLQHPE